MKVHFKTLVKLFGEPTRIENLEILERMVATHEHRVLSITDYGYGVIGNHIVDISHRWVFPNKLSEFVGYQVDGCP